MSIYDGLQPYIFRQKMEKTRFVREGMDGKVFLSRQSRHFSSVNIMSKVLFPTCTLTWRVNNYVFCQGKGMNRRSKNTIRILLLLFVALNNICLYVNCFSLKLVLHFLLF